MNAEMKRIVQNYRIFVILGEAGSGKTELACNLAVGMHETHKRSVHYLDMDVTKGIFRARDIRSILNAESVILHQNKEFLDTPTVPPGVEQILRSDNIAVVDVGGRENGAVVLGQYSSLLKTKECLLLYPVNCYREFSNTVSKLIDTRHRISDRSKLSDFRMVMNPNFGTSTTCEEWEKGIELTKNLFSEIEKNPLFAMAPKALVGKVSCPADIPVYFIQLYMQMVQSGFHYVTGT